MLEFSVLLLSLLNDYITLNPCYISQTEFYEYMIEDLFDYLQIYFLNDKPMIQFILYHKPKLWYDDINIFEFSFMLFFTHVYPLKFSVSDINHIADKEFIEIRLAELEYASNRILQRSEEWYAMRSNLLTASNIYKCFGSDSEKNQLIYEKCKEYNEKRSTFINGNSEIKYVNTDSSLQYGVRYEEITVNIYEKRNNVKIGMFGCIPHDTINFLGASPDGIIITPESPKYGRLVEIKNPKSREIKDDIKWEYWCQVQNQMEVCDLDVVEFIETKFSEYESEYEYSNDGTFQYSENGNEKGIILYFCENGKPIYEYKPLDMGPEDYDLWFGEKVNEYQSKNIPYVGSFYWKLDIFHVLYIERNRKWFLDNLPKMRELWDIILYEREDGYQHRKPKPRATKQNNTQSSCHPSLLFDI
jgi:putative phage-type endonuclease